MTGKSRIITHRGLECSASEFFSESSFEAFENHLNRGFSIEFDLAFALDGIVVSHENHLGRITNNELFKEIHTLYMGDLLSIRFKRGRLASFLELISLIAQSESVNNAIHFKGKDQTKENLDSFIRDLRSSRAPLEKFFVFDLKIESAKYLKKHLREIQLGASLSHPYDILRFNHCVSGTLYPIDRIIELKGLFQWLWLDEWDRNDFGGASKKFYTEENLEFLKGHGFSLACVTPELHATSPHLLGGESHEDAASQERLLKRMNEISSLPFDGICTDYPMALDAYTML